MVQREKAVPNRWHVLKLSGKMALVPEHLAGISVYGVCTMQYAAHATYQTLIPHIVGQG
jgi:hypothetical protein